MCQINTTHAKIFKEIFFKKDESVNNEMGNTFFYEGAEEQPPHSLMIDRLARSNFKQISRGILISNCLGGGTGGTGIRIC